MFKVHLVYENIFEQISHAGNKIIPIDNSRI